MFAWLRPAEPTKRFIPAGAIGVAGILFAVDRQFDFLSVATAFILVPLIASGLNLLSLPLMRAMSSSDAIASNLVDRLVRAIAADTKPRRAERKRVRRALMKRAQSVIADQLGEFWERRTNDPQLDRRLQVTEVTIVSLVFLSLAYFSATLVSLANIPRTPPSVVAAPPPETWVTAGLMIITAIFTASLANEIRSYRRLLWDEAPLLMAVSEYLDSRYWQEYQQYVESRRSDLGDALVQQYLATAHRRRQLALRGDFEKDWIEKAAADEIGTVPSRIVGLLDAAITTEREATVTRETPRRLLLIVALLVSFGALVASSAQSEVATVGVTIILLAVTILAYVVERSVARLTRSREIREARAKSIQDRIETLYAPLEQVATAMLQRPDEGYLPRFASHMDQELGGAKRHLALPATLAVYDSRGKGEPGDKDWALKLANTFLADYNQLVEEYRRLTKS